MRIRLLARHTSPKGCFVPGDVIDVPPAEGQQLIDGKYGVLEGGAPVPRGDRPPPVEHAVDDLTEAELRPAHGGKFQKGPRAPGPTIAPKAEKVPKAGKGGKTPPDATGANTAET